VKQLLMKLDGEATVHELADLARQEYPDRTLDTYLTDRLRQMEKKGFVENAGEKWCLTDKGRDTPIHSTIDDYDEAITEGRLSDYNLKITNIVGSLSLNKQLDLTALSDDLENTDYHPETYPSLIYRISNNSSLTILIPASGRISIVGATEKREMVSGVQELFTRLSELGIQIDSSPDDIMIQNIVANFDIKREIDLSAVSISLGLENTEYQPEQFPGLIYRGAGNSTVLLFRSGKCVITGARTYLEIVQARDELIQVLAENGVELEVKPSMG